MQLSAHFSEAGVAYSLFWVIPYLLLSLFLVIMVAQNHEPLATCSCWQQFLFQVIGDEVKRIFPLPLVLLSLCLRFLYAQIPDSVHVNSCWHLITFQITRDEVKGCYPLAYEDMNTEARLIASWILILHNSVLSALFWILSVLQLLWDELLNVRAPLLTHGLRLSLRQADNMPGIGVHLSLLSFFPFGPTLISLYWYSWFQPLMSICGSHFTRIINVIWVFVCIEKLSTDIL